MTAQDTGDGGPGSGPGRVAQRPGPATDRRTEEHARTARVVQQVVDPDSPVPAEGYTRVLHDVPAAVLLVHVGSGAVMHANPAARALTGGLALPTPARAWVDAAGLSAPGGQPYEPGESPLERAASGQPVFGEPVSVPDDASRRSLWVTGFPLPREDAMALVVLFDLDSSLPEARVRDRAIVAAGLSFTISDPGQADNPLVYVNPAFERTTGYSADEALGHNCRFLQGPDTAPQAVQRIRDALRREEHASITLLNYRKDGTAFWNEVSLSPVYDGHGTLTHFVGIQSDVTARVLVEQERARHLQAEQRARAAAEKAQRRLALLAEATSILAGTLDVDESIVRLTDLVVPLMADWCLVDLVEREGQERRRVGAHADPDKAELMRVVEQHPPGPGGVPDPVAAVLQDGQPVLMPHLTDDALAEMTGGSAGTYRELGVSSVLVVPLRARRQVLGTLTLVSADPARAYDEDDLTMTADLARRAALAVDNARLYEREHQVAEALQRSLLPQLPLVAGLDRAARYLPGERAAQVGGDWYDLFTLPDGAVGIAVGDVMGHDLAAAAAMGQLRSVLRSYAWQGSGPAVVLDHLDELVQGLDMAQLATAIYARLELPADGRPGHLRLANAGHLPPVLRMPDGTTRLLTEGQSVLVGAALGLPRDELTAELPPGSSLVLYTDGLVERRDRDPEDGLEALRAAVERADGADADTVCDELLSALGAARRDDDVALLVVRVL